MKRIVLLVILLASPSAAQTPPRYDLSFLGRADSVTALSENGAVVGQVTTGGATRGFIASVGSPLTLLPLPLGDQSSWALDVNELGVIVGATSTFSSPEFFGRAVRWQPDGAGGYTVEELGRLPGHSGSIATAVNNPGDVVGWSSSGMFRYPVLFTAPGGVLDLNPFGVFDPQSINDARVFVDKQGRRMDLDTMTVENLGLPAGPPTYQATSGYAINELGYVAGTAVIATSTSCVYQAARYVDGTGWQLLSACSPVANAYDINDQGDVLYKASLSLVNLLHLEGFGDFDLATMLAPSAAGWSVLGFGADINSARQIAAVVHDPTTGETGAALLTPAWTCQPSLGYAGPGTAALAVCGGDLSLGTSASLVLWGAPAGQLAVLVLGPSANPTRIFGGTLVPVPLQLLALVTVGPAGTFTYGPISGGRGPSSLYVQAGYRDPSLPGLWGFSNAVRIDFLP